MKQINVEEIMTEIRKGIIEKGEDESILSFEDPADVKIDDDSLQYEAKVLIKACEELSLHYELTVWHPINSTKPVFGSLITFSRKIMRKLTRFFIQPIVEDQSCFNQEAARGLNQIRNYLLEKEKLQKECDKRIDELLVKQAELNDRIKHLEEEQKQLKNR